MNKTYLVLIGSLLTSHFAVANSPANTEFPTQAIQPKTHAEPVDYPQFSHILSSSKLQISTPYATPGSKYELAKTGDFEGIINEHFYVDSQSQALVFNMAGYKLRNELRVLDNFSVSEPTLSYRLRAKLLPVAPEKSVENSPSGKKEITYLQVHNKGNDERGNGYIPHPLTRITWELERNGQHGHYWAVLKTNALDCSTGSKHHESLECKHAYQHVDLGPADLVNPTDFDIHVGGNRLVIKVNDEVKLTHNIRYWQNLLSYFKAGVYNQFENGKSEAHFYQLDYIIER